MEYNVRVLEVLFPGDLAFSVRFERPDTFSFLPGQFIIVSTGTGTPASSKPLSLSGSPTDSWLEVTKGSTGHPFAEWLRGLKRGDEVTIRGPLGRFTFQGEFPKVAFIAGGIGITPLWSMIGNAIAMKYDTDITLLYSAKTEAEFLFREKMTELEKAGHFLSIVRTVTEPGPGWSGHTGRIDRNMIEQEIPDWQERIFFVSGPPVMVNAMLAVLKEMGLPPDHIRYEDLTGY
ncbi:MAG: FAD-dependent oxidoreductase [Methanoregula sp.]|nr:FAD-dependent oxidoreductase [Methanoregula sp.]